METARPTVGIYYMRWVCMRPYVCMSESKEEKKEKRIGDERPRGLLVG